MILRKNVTFRNLAIADAISTLGDWCSSIVLPIILYGITKDVAATATLILCRFLPALFANPILKKFQDKCVNAVSVMQYMDILRAVVFLGFIVATEPWHFYVLTLIVYTGSALSKPCKSSFIRICCAPDELSRANNTIGLIQNSFMLVGPLAGGILYQLMGLKGVVVFNSCTFLASYVFLRRIKLGAPDVAGAQSRRFVEVMKKFSKMTPVVLALIGTDAISGVAFGALNTLLPVIAQHVFDNSSFVYGLLMSALSCGLLMGNVVFGRLSRDMDMARTYIGATIVAIVGFLLLGVTDSLFVMLLFLALVGTANSVQDLSLITSIQRTSTSDVDMALVFSIHETLSAIAIVASTLVVTYLLTLLGKQLTFVALAMFAVVGGLAILGSCARSLRNG